jgi:hypothetical protein
LASVHARKSLQFLKILPYVSLGLANKSDLNHLLVFSSFWVKGGVQMEALTLMLIKLAGTFIWALEDL